MNFDQAFERFMEKHLNEAQGLRRERLKKGLGYGEMLFLRNGWWEAFGNLDHLYPEFMVSDWQEGVRFLDFAYIRPPYYMDFEIDGYTPHHTKLDRRGFEDERDRQNYLVMDHWRVFRFSVDKLRDRPRDCQRQLRLIMGIFYGDEETAVPTLTRQELMILHHAGIHGDSFTPGEVSAWLGISGRQARTYLHRLADLGYIEPARGSKRIRAYRLASRWKHPAGEGEAGD